MLTISKPTLFSPDGLAARGQCNHDSPGWQLRWFDRETPPITIWQGAFKTCRHLQTSCASAATLEEVKAMVEDLLNTNSFAHFTSQPTDAYPTPARVQVAQNHQEPPTDFIERPHEAAAAAAAAAKTTAPHPQQRKKRKKKKH